MCRPVYLYSHKIIYLIKLLWLFALMGRHIGRPLQLYGIY